MRTFFLSSVFALLVATPAMAGVVTSSSGAPVTSVAGPVTQGGYLVEGDGATYGMISPAQPAQFEERQCERTITVNRGFIGGIKSGLLAKGFHYTGKHTWTKTVVHTKTVQTKAAKKAKFGYVHGGGGNGNARGGGKDNGGAGPDGNRL